MQVSRSLQTSNQQAAMNRLIREFGNSYFFYYGFGRVGVTLSEADGSDKEHNDAAGRRRLAQAQ